MTDKLKSYLEDASKDTAHMEKLRAARTPEEMLALAREKGHELSLEDLKREPDARPLSTDELDAVAGGGECYCVFAGYGQDGLSDDVCGCPVGGAGTYWDGKQHDMRCVCPEIGYGESYDHRY